MPKRGPVSGRASRRRLRIAQMRRDDLPPEVIVGLGNGCSVSAPDGRTIDPSGPPSELEADRPKDF